MDFSQAFSNLFGSGAPASTDGTAVVSNGDAILNGQTSAASGPVAGSYANSLKNALKNPSIQSRMQQMLQPSPVNTNPVAPVPGNQQPLNWAQYQEK